MRWMRLVHRPPLEKGCQIPCGEFVFLSSDLYYLSASGLWTISILKAVFLKLGQRCKLREYVHFTDLRAMIVHKACAIHSQFSRNAFNPPAFVPAELKSASLPEIREHFYCSLHPHLSFCVYTSRRQSTLLLKESIVALAGHPSRGLSFEYLEFKEESVFWNFIWKQVILYLEQLFQRNSYGLFIKARLTCNVADVLTSFLPTVSQSEYILSSNKNTHSKHFP